MSAVIGLFGFQSSDADFAILAKDKSQSREWWKGISEMQEIIYAGGVSSLCHSAEEL
jgi:hypothetical protein